LFAALSPVERAPVPTGWVLESTLTRWRREEPLPRTELRVVHPIFTVHTRLVRFRQQHLKLACFRPIDCRGQDISLGSARVINAFLGVANITLIIRSRNTYIAYIYRHKDVPFMKELRSEHKALKPINTFGIQACGEINRPN
jgi:hypothetical protein